MQFTLKMKLNCHDQSDRVRYVTKSNKDKDVIKHISLVYTETKTIGNYSIGYDLWWKLEKKMTWLIV